MATTRSNFISHLNLQLETGRQKISDFQAKVLLDPLYQMTWADPYVETCAQVGVRSQAWALLDDPNITLDQIREHLQTKAMSMARSPERSTSPMHNLAKQCELQATVQLLEDMRRVKEDE